MALHENEIVEKFVEVNYLLKFDYTIMNEVMRILKQYECAVISQEMTLFCDLTFSVKLDNETLVISKLEKLRNVEIQKLLTE